MAEFKTGTGAKVLMNPGSWESTMNLKNALERAMIGTGFQLNLGNIKGGLSAMKDVEIDLGKIIELILKVDSSPEVNAAIMECLEKCTYNNEKITTRTFEDNMDARRDYYSLVTSCIAENITPFIEGLPSALSGLGKLAALIIPK